MTKDDVARIICSLIEGGETIESLVGTFDIGNVKNAKAAEVMAKALLN